MEILDNVNRRLVDDLKVTIQTNDKLSIASAYFSIYAFDALKDQLKTIEELRFIFTSPTFLHDRSSKERREFFIPEINRERSLFGTEFEVRLRNELTQKSIARECAAWIKEKAKFRSNLTSGVINTFLDIEKEGGGYSYTPLNGFTTSDLGCERGNNISVQSIKFPHEESTQFLESFNALWNDKKLLQDVTDVVLEGISAAYSENSPEFIYYVTIYNIFNEFLSDISEDVLPNEATGFKNTRIWNMLYDFQRDAALAIINKLETYNGCILADSVGLGKTFTALAVIKYYELRNRNVMVLCPKKLHDNWYTYRENYLNNPLASDRLRYDVLYHTDLLRERGYSGGTDLSKFNWSNYDLIVIDESHNFRNGGDYSGTGDDRRENRYLQLLNNVIRKGVKSRVLMLSATPVNNGFSDLRHQLELAYEGNPALINDKLDTTKPVDVIFRSAQAAFNKWSKYESGQRTTENLLKLLEFDFFTLLDSVTIARSRKHIERYYDIDSIGKFPERMKPLSLRPSLTNLPSSIDYDGIYEQLNRLNLAVYVPTNFLLESRRSKYIDPETNIDRAGREAGIRRLMCINLLKRLESSVASFRITLERVHRLINETIVQIDNHTQGAHQWVYADEAAESELDYDDQNSFVFSRRNNKMDIDLDDMDYVSWRERLKSDADILSSLMAKVKAITPENDLKLQSLLTLIQNKIEQPINDDNKKILIFSAFADTVGYLFTHVAPFAKQRFGLDSAMITGSVEGKTTAPVRRSDMNTILTLFSPRSKDKQLLMPDDPATIEILIATDCISEGQNLQDCDYCINYDIHWNPVRIIQRFGRIDRIGSKNDRIQLVNFWPNVDLDRYLELKGRVETRMKASILSATGDDNPISPEELGDLEYRKAQLEKLQNEVVDIEEMQSGISIMDLGLNEFRLDLLDYVKEKNNLEGVPAGLHAVVGGDEGAPPGVVYILRNRNANLTEAKQNQLHPFYMVYIKDDESVFINHMQPKKLLDLLRKLCKGKKTPDIQACRTFNKETLDGKRMTRYSTLLDDTIKSIVQVGETNALDQLLAGKPVSLASKSFDGLDDFELICFFRVL